MSLTSMKLKFTLNKPNPSNHSKLYIKSSEPDKNKIKRAKELIIKNFSQYPEVLKGAKLKNINLVSNLQVINNAEIGIYVKNSSSPDPESYWMYFDVDYVDNEKYFEECVNHEIWHLFEYSMTGSFRPEDPNWFKLNPKDFKYGQGGWYAYHNKFENNFHPIDGFITSYATLQSDEDKAETFMYMFTEHLKGKLEEICKRDKLLNEKVKLLNARLLNLTSHQHQDLQNNNPKSLKYPQKNF